MRCPECSYRVMIVIKTSDSNSMVRRTRECPKCYHRAKTEETFVDEQNEVESRLLMLEKQIEHMQKKENVQ